MNRYSESVQAMDQTIQSLPMSELPRLMGELERLKNVALTRLIQRPESDKGILFDAKQVAERLRVPESYVYELARRGELKSAKLGKYRRFSESAIRDYLNKAGS